MVGDVTDMVEEVTDMVWEVTDMVQEVKDMVGEVTDIAGEVMDNWTWSERWRAWLGRDVCWLTRILVMDMEDRPGQISADQGRPE